MLVLSRKEQQRIVINPQSARPITLTVVEIDGNKVRIGIEAPREVVVMREELLYPPDGVAELAAHAKQLRNGNREEMA